MMIEEMDKALKESREVISISKAKVKIKFFLDPSIKSFNNWIIRRSPPSCVLQSLNG